MSDIIKSVSSAFAVTRDARIDYHIVEKGAASLITGIYGQGDDVVDGFYKKPAISSNGDATKLAIIYGEVMITPYLIDQGVENSANNPGAIMKTYRYITGDGVNSGIPNGPNGTPLQNIYINQPGSTTPQPVVDSSGKPTLGNVILASALGGLISSAPKIWDLITGNTPASAKTPNKDPVTGKEIGGTNEKSAEAIAKQIPLGKLSDVDDTSKGDKYVLMFDVEKQKWIAAPLNDALDGMLGITGACGGTGGTGGSGGSGGTGGTGGTGGSGGGDPTPTPDPCAPIVSFIEYPCVTAPTTTKSGTVLLPTLVNTANNEYTQSINVLGTNGIELHFYAAGAGKRAIWRVAAGEAMTCTDPSTDFLCLEDPDKKTVQRPASPAAEVRYVDPGEYDIQICLTTNICGIEYLIYKSTFSESALSKTGYSFTAPQILWGDTKIGELLTKYPGQVFNASNPNVKLYLSRTDVCGSEFDLHFEGYKRILGDTYFRGVTKSSTTRIIQPTTVPTPTPVMVKADDGKFPDQAPSGGGMGAPSCPAETEIPGTPGSPGLPGTPGTGGVPGHTGGPGTCGDITVAPAKAQPTISLESPCARSYGTQTNPPGFDDVELPAIYLDTKIADQAVEVTYKIELGVAEFFIQGELPSDVTFTFGTGTMTLVGDAAAVEQAAASAIMFPDPECKGEIHYTVVLKNAEDTKAGAACMVMPDQIVQTENQAAKGKVCVASGSTGGTGKVLVTFDGKTVDLTDGFVPYAGSPEATATAIADNINYYVTFQHALEVGSEGWLPYYQATASGDTVTVAAPTDGGGEFNGAELTTETTGDFVFGDCVGTFMGGITKTISDLLSKIPYWDKIGDILLSIAGNTVGAVLLNMLITDSSQLQITIPDTGSADVDIFFLYRGRIIQVPNEYNAEARTGHPSSYAAFSGSWKQQYTTNPAWIAYDFITNKKYGLGNDIILSGDQQTALLQDIFRIGYYSDDIISGKPRFSTNTVITEGTKLQILQQLCSVFYGSVVFHNGGLRITNDMPNTQIKLLVNQANAGSFDKALSSSKNFINKTYVTYVEPSNYYTENVVIAENSEAVMNYGERITDIVAFGCTDADQATRYATWVLKSELENSVIVSYTAGFDHYNLIPGDIVEFHDSNERNIRRAGRIVSQTGTFVIVDAPLNASNGDFFSLTLSNGEVHQTTIASISGVNVTLASAPPVPANPYATFIAASASLGRRLYKVVKIDETSNSKFAITLQLYSTDKY